MLSTELHPQAVSFFKIFTYSVCMHVFCVYIGQRTSFYFPLASVCTHAFTYSHIHNLMPTPPTTGCLTYLLVVVHGFSGCIVWCGVETCMSSMQFYCVEYWFLCCTVAETSWVTAASAFESSLEKWAASSLLPGMRFSSRLKAISWITSGHNVSLAKETLDVVEGWVWLSFESK